MATLALEIHDVGIRAKREGDRRASIDSPGFAMVDGSSLLTGVDARAACRLRPRYVDNRFWSELDSEPLPSPFAGDSRADLAHAHLRGLWADIGTGVDQVILVVPGSYDDRQLGLLLGIAEACNVPVCGLLDAALSACPLEPADGHLLHLDVQLHRTVVTELVSGAELSRREVKVTPGIGMVGLYDAWMRRIAERFVRHRRFDPLHVAKSEQALYDSLPRLLQDLRERDRVELELEASGKSRGVEFSREELVDAVSGMLNAAGRVVGSLTRVGRPSRLLLSHRAAAVPGFRERLSAIAGVETLTLEPEAGLDGALRNHEAIRSDGTGFSFVTRFPRIAAVSRTSIEPPPRTKRTAGGEAGDLPTHVLHGDRAYAIDDRPLALGVAAPQEGRGIRLTGETAGISRNHCSLRKAEGRVVLEDRSRHGTFLNGKRVELRADLVSGDRLRLGSPGVELRLIRVEKDHGAP